MHANKNITIVSWNVNGLRALARKGYFDEMMDLNADIYCLQETKTLDHELKDEIKNPEGYYSYFFSSEERKGHAGTAVYTKEKPENIVYGLPHHPDMDKQGRTITLHFKNFTIVNCYFPNGGSETSNLKYKLKFYEVFLSYINKLRDDGKNIIIAGDWNIAHTEIDIARPKENATHIGFLPEERTWLDRYEKENWIDVWRNFNPDLRDVYTYWDTKSRARDRNVGWRIDYFFINKSLLNNIKRAEILNDIYGSDHCPILINISI